MRLKNWLLKLIFGQENEELLKKINSLEREIKNLQMKYKK